MQQNAQPARSSRGSPEGRAHPGWFGVVVGVTTIVLAVADVS